MANKETKNPLDALWKPDKSDRNLNYIAVGVIVAAAIALLYIAVSKTRQTPTASSSPCLVLQSQYCASGKLVTYPQSKLFIGFDLPTSTVIYAPFDGYANYVKEGGSLEAYAQTASSTGEYFEYFGFMTPLQKTGAYVTKGKPLAQISGEVIDQVSNSNLLLDFQSVAPDRKLSPSLDLMHRYFPQVKI